MRSRPALRFLFVVLSVCAGTCVANPLFDPPLRLAGDVPAMTVSGPSGGLNIPDGRVLPDGDVVFGYNNYLDPSFVQANGAQNYLFGYGAFPFVELTGRIADYTKDRESDFILRHISGNIKVELPKLFSAQPDVAFGANDFAGATRAFSTKYVSASEGVGWLSGTLGVARGEPYLNGIFGGASLALGHTGLSALAEHTSGNDSLGLRYASVPIAVLGNASIVATAQHAFRASAIDGSKFDRTTLGVNLVIPFGANARNVKMPEPPADVVWTPPPGYRDRNELATSDVVKAPLPVPDTIWTPPPGYRETGQRASAVTENTIKLADSGLAELTKGELPTQKLEKLRAKLEKAGLERVRVGVTSNKLVIEYENHRYNQNEVDALGIALGLGARMAPDSLTRISVITKKAGLPLYESMVSRLGYLRFLESGDKYEAREGMEVTMRPVADPLVQWLDAKEGARGYSRILLEPSLIKYVGTEVGLFDYSLALSVNTLVPLWKGAEISADYVRSVAASSDIKQGLFGPVNQASGLKSATLNQAFWVTDHILDVVSAGKFMYDFAGFQNETTILVPGRDDQIDLQFTRVHMSQPGLQETEVTMAANYRWVYQPLDLWVEAGYSKFLLNDRGPTLSISRWFGDIEGQVYLLHSNLGSFAGFQFNFPLTPRQGMRPGFTHLEGAGSHGLGLQTLLASHGNCNCINTGIAQQIPIGYSTDEFLLNDGRYGRNYVISQLPRMREALLLYTTLE